MIDNKPHQSPLVIAHRGASATFPENTIAAFVGAREQGADAVELDARRTADGKIVVHHDASLPDGRTIVEAAAAQLPDSVASLAEALAACDGMVVNIEIKNMPHEPDFDETESVADAVVALAATAARKRDLLVSSFHLPTIDHVLGRDPELETAFLTVDGDGYAALRSTLSHGHHVLHPWDRNVDAGLVAAAHAEGVRVNVWTVDDPQRMLELAAMGVDGIVTNKPDLARSTLDRSTLDRSTLEC